MFSGEVQTYFAYALILTFGVLHGANDISVIRLSAKKGGVVIGFKKVLTYYILSVSGISLLFLGYPPAALALFIILSAYHFGEQHLSDKMIKNTPAAIGLYFFYGLTILFMIFYNNLDNVILILKDVMGYEFSSSFFEFGLMIPSILLLCMFLCMNFLKKIRVNLVEEFFYLLVLFLVFSTANLLWGFCIYFVIWHSLPSLLDQIKYLYGNSGKQEFFRYLGSSWIYWAASIGGLCILFIAFSNDRPHQISILIYFLAAITFPHVLVMSRLKHS